MSDAIPLPPNPNPEQYKKLAKDLQRACQSGGETAVGEWAKRWVTNLTRLRGIEITPAISREIQNSVDAIEHTWHKLKEKHEGFSHCVLADMQWFIAHTCGFVSWATFLKHIEALQREHSSIFRFEAAVDAIVSGDTATLTRLLRENPQLARERSTREHRSMLLHYVSANGVENFRQKTPENIVEIAKLLLDSGAEVNAESEAYGGGSTPLVLAATSVHPERAGVQEELMQLLLDHGAIIEKPGTTGNRHTTVKMCLANGRGKAAEFLAARGADLNLEGAAGVGRLDIVKDFFDENGNLKPIATKEELQSGFAWACEFGRTDVVEFLLPRGVTFDIHLWNKGQTGLHWAAYGGHADIVKLLLARGAPVNTKDQVFGGTPLGWAIHAWTELPEELECERYCEITIELLGAGARLDEEWRSWSDDRLKWFKKKIASDPRMIAAIGRTSIFP